LGSYIVSVLEIAHCYQFFDSNSDFNSYQVPQYKLFIFLNLKIGVLKCD
jgi:hypothetical protein